MPTVHDEARGYGMTVTEVATVADVPTRYVYHVIDKHILPDALCERDQGWRFAHSVPFLVALDAAIADFLTIDARKGVYVDFFRHCAAAVIYETKSLSNCRWDEDWPAWPSMSAMAEIWNSDVENLPERIRNRHADLMEANAVVVSNPGILSGTPVIKGTRVPAYDLAASVDAGIGVDEIAEAYPAVTRRHVELASLWAKAHPPVGRPRAVVPDTSNVKRVPRKKHV